MGTNRFRVVFVHCVAVAVAVTACLSIIASVQAYIRVGSAETAARKQLVMTSADISRAADSLQTVSDSLVNASVTATNVQSVIANAAAIVQGTSTAIDSAGNRVGFNIPFTDRRPFGNAEDTLKSQAAQVDALADSLNRTATSLGTNAADLRVIAADVEAVATRLRELSRSVAQFAGNGNEEGGLAKIAGAARTTAVASIFLGVLSVGVAGALWLLAAGGPTADEVATAMAAQSAARTQQAAAPAPVLETAEAPPAT